MSAAIPLRLLGIGPQRTGSTWLDAQLRHHPDLVFPAHVKETFFFDRHWARGVEDYQGHFPVSSIGWAEIGPTYFDHPDVPKRVARIAPEVRIVATLRDPVGRAVSLWQHHLRKGRVGPDFWAAADAIPTILTAGDYADHLPRWHEAVGLGRVLVLLTDDLRTDPQAALDRITEFADLSGLVATPDADERVNTASAPRFPRLARAAARTTTLLRDARLHRLVEAGKALGLAKIYAGGASPPTLSASDRERLKERYAPHVEYVDDLLGRPTGWLASPPA